MHAILRSLRRIVSDLKLGADAERIARQLLRENPVPNGSSPLLWCAACVYEASKRIGETRGQREFKVYGSEVSLRRNWERLPQLCPSSSQLAVRPAEELGQQQLSLRARALGAVEVEAAAVPAASRI